MNSTIIIKSITGKTIYTTENCENIKEAILQAIKNEIDLSGSDLSGSDLSGSDLSWSNLSGSNLSGSDLRWSDLSGSDLSGSNLRGSNLSGSNLSGSDLSGSDLRGSNLRGSKGIIGVLTIGPIGSRNDYLTIIRLGDNSLRISTGCFRDKTLDEFKAAVDNTHNGRCHGINYKAAIALIESFKWSDEEIENKSADCAEAIAKEEATQP